MKNIIKIILVLCLGLFLGACSPINKANILEIASKETPENFKIKDLEIVDIDKHYDSNNNSATDFNVIYHFESTQDRYEIEYVEPDFNDLYTNVFFTKKVVSKGDVLVCKLKGRYELNKRYNKYELRVEGLYNFKPTGHTLDVLSTGKRPTNAGYISYTNVIHKEYNNKERKTVKLIEIASEEEKDYLARKAKFYKILNFSISGVMVSPSFVLYSKKAGEVCSYDRKNNVLRQHNYSIDEKTGELVLTNSPFAKTKYYTVNQDATSITFATNKSTRANSSKYVRIRTTANSKDFPKKLKQFIVGTWAYSSSRGKVDEYKFEANGDLTYATIMGSRRSMIYYKWEIVEDGFVKITDKKTGKSFFRFVSYVDLDYLTMGSKFKRTSSKSLITYGNSSTPVSVVYDYVGDFKEGLALVKKAGKLGYINEKGEAVVPVEYDKVYPFKEGLASVKKAGKWGYVNKKGEAVVPLIYDFVEPFLSKAFGRVKKDGKWGYMNAKGEIVIPIKYDNLGLFFLEFSSVKKDGKWGYINKKGEIVIPITLKYDEVGFLYDGFAKVKKDGKWGYINDKGEVVVPAILEYDDVGHALYMDFIKVKKDGKWGCINTKGKVVIPIEYDSVEHFYLNGLARVKKAGKTGLISTEGKVVVPIEYDSVESFKDGLARVKKAGKSGMISTEGKVVVPIEYDFVESFKDGLVRVKKAGKSGLISIEGKVVIPMEYDSVGSFKDGLAGVKKDGKWGFINNKGALVVPVECDGAGYLCEGFAGVKKDGKWGFINTEGKVVVPIEYDSVDSFKEGFAGVKKDGKWGFVNNKGAVVVPIEYDFVGSFKDGLARVKKDGKWGFVNNKGAVVIPVTLEFDYVGSFNDGLALVKKSGKYGYLNTRGGIVVSIIYDSESSLKEALSEAKRAAFNFR